MLLTIITGTNRPTNIKEMVLNLESTAQNPERIEIIFAVDTGDNNSIDVINELKNSSKINIKYLEDIRSRGYFSANHHYNKCLHIADKTSYFFANFSDKTRMKTKGWDAILKKYVKHFNDDVFRIRISCYKNYRYNFDLLTALQKPDNFAFHTRKFVQLCGGWGDLWGPDTWAQGVVFFCELLGINNRDLVDSEIELEEYVYTSSEQENKASFLRSQMICWSFNYLATSKIAIQNFCRIATKIQLYLQYRELFSDPNVDLKYTYEGNKVKILDDHNVVIAETENKYKTAKTNFITLFNGLNKSSKKIDKRFEKIKHSKNSLKKLAYFLNIKFLKIRDDFSFIASGIKLFCFKSSKCNKCEIIKLSSCDQFSVEQNEEIEKQIRKKYYEFYAKAIAKFPKNN